MLQAYIYFNLCIYISKNDFKSYSLILQIFKLDFK